MFSTSFLIFAVECLHAPSSHAQHLLGCGRVFLLLHMCLWERERGGERERERERLEREREKGEREEEGGERGGGRKSQVRVEFSFSHCGGTLGWALALFCFVVSCYRGERIIKFGWNATHQSCSMVRWQMSGGVTLQNCA